MAGSLYVCATPIGNLGDVSERLVATLAAVDVIFAEDTRRTGRLLSAVGVDTPLRSFFTGNERERSSELGRRLVAGANVALVSDAGTPAISDPGLLAVAEAISVGATVIPIPGPSAVTALLSVSGLPSDRFVFDGFLPRKKSLRAHRLAEIADQQRTTVLFITPHRAGDDLADLARELGADRVVVVGRELTKLHEEVWTTTLGEAAERYGSEQPKGELVVAIAGTEPPEGDLAGAVEAARLAMAGGASTKDAAREAAGSHGVPRNAVYDALIAGAPDSAV
jgi:16S rRNA (cytidine1402-2'-O)-methyltransferase